MEFINPRLTIQNVQDGGQLHCMQVRMEHIPNPDEKIDVTVFLRGPDLPDASVDQVQQRVIAKVLAILQAMQRR